MEVNKCPIVKDLLPLYVDGALSPESSELVETHLKNCDACEQEARRMQREFQDMISPAQITAPVQNLQKKYFKRLIRGIGITAVIALVLLGGFFAWYIMPIMDGIYQYDEKFLTVEKVDDHYVMTSHPSAAHRKIYFFYDITEDDHIAVYLSFGDMAQQCKDAILYHDPFQKTFHLGINLPGSDSDTGGENGTCYEIETGDYGYQYVIDDMESVTFPSQVTEIYYIPDLTKEVWERYAKDDKTVTEEDIANVVKLSK